MRAILLKELRSYMRGVRAFRLLTIYLAIVSVPLLLYYSAEADRPFVGFQDVGETFFVVANLIALAQLTLLTPANASGSIGGERERQTFDLLLVTPISSAAIILAKLAAPVLFLSLMALATVPISAIAFFIGGVTLTDLLLSLLIMLVSAFGYGSIGIFASVMTKTSRGAATMAIAITVFLAVGMPILFILIESAANSGRGGSSLLEWPLLPLGLTILSISPLAAFFFTRRRLFDMDFDSSIWTIDLPTRNGSIEAPAPWVLLIIIWLVISAILLAISIRRLRRGSEEAS